MNPTLLKAELLYLSIAERPFFLQALEKEGG
jgi:hypothetical protein